MTIHSSLNKLVLGAILTATCSLASAEIVFYSTQARPLEEAQKMRDEVPSDFSGDVQFSPQEAGPFYTRIEAEQEAGEVTLGLLGALHGDFPPIQAALDPVDDVMGNLADRNISETFAELGKLGTDRQQYIPWMQATYIMGANKEALQYLPEGADVNPRSTAYNFMQEPLLSGEVWVAFDHTSRLKDAFDQKPDQFIAFPAPSGPEGSGFMPVVAGLAIPKGTPDRDQSVQLIEYLIQPETQVKTLRATGFFPVVEVELPDDLPPNVQISGAAVTTQANASNANPLQRMIDKTGAPCWAPDQPSDGPCPVN